MKRRAGQAEAVLSCLVDWRPRAGRGLTEIDELFYRERRGVELRVEVQHLADVAQAVPCELHAAVFR